MKRNEIYVKNGISFLFIIFVLLISSHVFLAQLYYLNMAMLAETCYKTHYICE